MHRIIRYIFLVSILFSQLVKAQDSISHQKKNKRLIWVGAGSAVVYGAALVGLNEAWYKGYPRSDFHFINDNSQWKQMDKCGHVFSSYAYGLAGIELMKWTGLERKKAIWIGGLAGTLFQTPIEILDGYSAQWGASWGDLAANSIGSILVISQELAWDEQRFYLKFSFSPTSYSSIRPNVLGSRYYESVLKDYNGQTYWLSANLHSLGIKKLPPYLSLALGYGAEGLLGARQNTWTDAEGNFYDYSHIRQHRLFYLSPDIDLSKIPVKSKALKRILKIANCIKLPSPALSYRDDGMVKFHWMFF